MSIIGLFFAGTLALLFVSAAVAPLESLGWYAGWFGEKEEEEPQELLTPDPAGEISPASHYLVYLSGIGAIAPNSIPSEELPFIAGLQQKLPDSLVITDVFPYSVTNLGLTGQRVTARVWRCGRASAGIQLAPLQKMSTPLTRNVMERPSRSSRLTTSSVRSPMRLRTSSPATRTVRS